MSEKNLKVRVINKHDTSANWTKATNFIPKKGEIIVYDDLNKIKIGDGSTVVSNLKFVETDISGKYTKPSTGIPKTDLASAVQTSLNNADAAAKSVKLNGTTYTASNGVVDLKTIKGKDIQGSGINSLVNNNNAVGLNPAINGAGNNIEKGGWVKCYLDDYLLELSTSAQKSLFDGINSTNLAPFNPAGIAKTIPTYDSTKTYSKGDIVRNTTASGYTWYRSKLDSNTGNAITVGSDNTYWEYVSGVGSSYLSQLNPQKFSTVTLEVRLINAASYENGVSLYWRTNTQHPKYVTIEKWDNNNSAKIADVVVNQDMTGETVTTVYLGAKGTAYGQYFRFIFSGFSGTNMWSCCLCQMAFTGNVGGIEGTAIMRCGGRNYSSMYGEFLPYTSNSINLGNSSYNWNGIYGKTIYEGGKSLSTLYQPKGNYLTSITKDQIVNALGYTPLQNHQDISGKQDKLSTTQLSAVNSGITNDKVTKYDGYSSTLTSLGNAANDHNDRLTTLEAKPGLDKVGTVTKVNNTTPDSNGNVTILIPSAVTETTVSNWGFTKNTGTYSKPSDGIPKSDLSAEVQNKLSQTITDIKFNNKSAAAVDGVADLGSHLPVVTAADYIFVTSYAWTTAIGVDIYNQIKSYNLSRGDMFIIKDGSKSELATITSVGTSSYSFKSIDNIIDSNKKAYVSVNYFTVSNSTSGTNTKTRVTLNSPVDEYDANTTDAVSGKTLYADLAKKQDIITEDNKLSYNLLSDTPPQYDTAELDITFGEDGTLTDEQVSYLESFSNLKFICIPYLKNKTSGVILGRFYLTVTQTLINNTTNKVQTIYATLGNTAFYLKNTNSIVVMMNLRTKKYTWEYNSSDKLILSKVRYNTDGTLDAAYTTQLVLSTKNDNKFFLPIIEICSDADDYGFLTYVCQGRLSSSTAKGLLYSCPDHKDLYIDVLTGAYEFRSNEITAYELSQKIEDGTLIPGKTYRVNDYCPIWCGDNFAMAGNQFDILITAIDNSTIDENVHFARNANTSSDYQDVEKWEGKVKIYSPDASGKQTIQVFDSSNSSVTYAAYAHRSSTDPKTVNGVTSYHYYVYGGDVAHFPKNGIWSTTAEPTNGALFYWDTDGTGNQASVRCARASSYNVSIIITYLKDNNFNEANYDFKNVIHVGKSSTSGGIGPMGYTFGGPNDTYMSWMDGSTSNSVQHNTIVSNIGNNYSTISVVKLNITTNSSPNFHKVIQCGDVQIFGGSHHFLKNSGHITINDNIRNCTINQATYAVINSTVNIDKFQGNSNNLTEITNSGYRSNASVYQMQVPQGSTYNSIYALTYYYINSSGKFAVGASKFDSTSNRWLDSL